jgi:RNA polymerase sigma factor (sigma-70 family)
MAFNLIKNDVSTNVYYVNRNDSIDRYLNSIRKYKPLTFEQENECITRYKVDGDLKARDMLVNSQQLQIYSQAKKLSNNPDVVLELVNEGNIGLMEAIDRFDFTKGCRLFTFAAHYIYQAMNYYFCRNRLVKRPSDEKIGSRVATEREIFFKINERMPTIEELRSIMLNKYGVNVKSDSDLEVPEYIYVDNNIVDDDNDNFTYGNTPEYLAITSSENDYEAMSEKDDTKASVLAALGKLGTRTAEIIKMLYGIDYPREYTPKEIGELYGMTPTRINQIRREATKKLQYLITA